MILMLSNVTKYTNSEILIFQNTLLKYKRREYGDSKMKEWTSKILGGFRARNIPRANNVSKNETVSAQKGVIQMTGVYSAGNASVAVPKSNFAVPQDIVDKYAEVSAPKGKPTKLVIADEYYIPDREYAEAEV